MGQVNFNELLGFLELPLNLLQVQGPCEGWFALANTRSTATKLLWQRVHGVPQSAELFIHAELTADEIPGSKTGSPKIESSEVAHLAAVNGCFNLFADLVYADSESLQGTSEQSGAQSTRSVKTTHWVPLQGVEQLSAGAGVLNGHLTAQVQQESKFNMLQNAQPLSARSGLETAGCFEICTVSSQEV